MYELVNTSVPNGLIAGTHGFATVVLTKGMPDAIRVRVEGLCAYPHRTSAHDASYYSENPVNWFHLTVAGDGHVVGRTAPAEFDYTGRTNRLSRTLFFAAREMPAAGGVAVLEAANDRFCEGWQGEPRYVTEDRSLADRLRQIDRPRGADSSHWRALLGPQGTEYARRFAALLRQNLRTGKSLFFKAAKADVDGTRLLGLFEDLINLLPDNLAAQVTFSTFAACVPSGCVCHLRGIYDKDRAFEVASALQPWVDCESGTVQHAELLTQEDRADVLDLALRRDEPAAEASSAGLGRNDRLTRGRSMTGSRQETFGAARNRVLVTKPRRSLPLGVILGASLAVLAFVGGGVGFWIWYDVGQRRKADSLLQQAEAERMRARDEWYACATNRVEDFRKKVAGCASSEDLEKLRKEIGNAQAGLKQSLEEAGCRDYEQALSDVRGRYASLAEELNKMQASLKKREEEVARLAKAEAARQRDQHEKVDARKRQEAEEQARKDVAAEKERKRREAIERPLDSLQLTEILSSSQSWVDRVKDEETRALTNHQSIVFHFLLNGVLTNETARLMEREARDPMSGRKTRRWIVEGGTAAQTRHWFVVSIPSKKEVYWQWRTPIEGLKLFEQTDSVNLANLVFGGTNEAFRVYGKRCQPIVYVISWETEEGAFAWYVTGPDVSIDRLEPDQQRLVKKIDQLESEVNKKKEVLSSYEKGLQEACKSLSEMTNAVVRYRALDEKCRNEKDAKKKQGVRNELNKLEESACTNFSRFALLKQKMKDGKVMLKGVDEKMCQEAVARYQKEQSERMADVREKIARLERNVRRLKKLRDDWRLAFREMTYSVNVRTDGHLLDIKLTKDEKTRWRDERKIDKIVPPTGVGGN